MKFFFNKKYFFLFLLLFIVEVLIALYVHDNFIRPYIGDYLVIFLMYYFVISFVDWNKYVIAFGVLLIAFGVEFLQYINFISMIDLQNSKFASTIIGTSFSIEDLGIYLLAYFTITTIERFKDEQNKI